MPAQGSRAWRAAFKLQYRILALIDPLVLALWRRFGVGNVVELEVESRRGGGTRRRLIGLLRVGDERFVGHPNGEVGWTRDLRAAGTATIRWPEGSDWSFSAVPLAPGDAAREKAIRATGQHPFPGNVTYRLGRRHIRAVGVFFKLEPLT